MTLFSDLWHTDDWTLGCTTVSGTEEICIGGERFKIIFAPVITT